MPARTPDGLIGNKKSQHAGWLNNTVSSIGLTGD